MADNLALGGSLSLGRRFVQGALATVLAIAARPVGGADNRWELAAPFELGPCTVLVGDESVPLPCRCDPAAEPWVARAIDLRTGERAEIADMIDDLAQARVVYVGERHDGCWDHALQLHIVRAMHARDPALAVGLEAFSRPLQPVLDAYAEGRANEEELLRASDWEARGNVDFGMVRPVLAYARDKGIRALALNAPPELSRAVARVGIARLSPAHAQLLPELDASDGRHRRLVAYGLVGHSWVSVERMEDMYLAQLVWDESMAEVVAAALDSADGPRRIVALAGALHVLEGRGIPRRAARRGAEPYRVVLAAPGSAADYDWASSEEPMPADWIVAAGVER